MIIDRKLSFSMGVSKRVSNNYIPQIYKWGLDGGVLVSPVEFKKCL